MATTTEEARQSGDRYLVRRAFFDDRNEIYYALWQYGTLAMVVAPILSAHGDLDIGTTVWTGLKGQVVVGVPQPESWRDRSPGPCLNKVSYHDRDTLHVSWTQWELDCGLWPMSPTEAAVAEPPVRMHKAA
jgi:hypothetical protein